MVLAASWDFVAGSTMWSRLALTAFPSNFSPLEKVTSSRKVNEYVSWSGETVHSVASHGSSVPSAFRATSESRMGRA